MQAGKSIRELINDISFLFEEADIYFGHGTGNAFDEAVYLIFSLLDLPFDVADDQLNQQVESTMTGRIMELAHQRITTRIPLAYLVHKAWFCGLPFYVDERVLVPRSPIAELIEDGFEPWLDPAYELTSILDIGTGSGCIAISSALAFPGARVDAIDISGAALEVASINLETYGLGDRIQLIQSDLYQGLKGRCYDLIIANPPYVDAGDMEALPEEYRHEPELGLSAGNDGLDIVRRILGETRPYLADHGILVVEVGNSRVALEAAYPELAFTWLEFERGGEGVFLLKAEDLPALAGDNTQARTI